MAPRAVYPDAEIVFLHRDPVSVVCSCARLAERLRRPVTNHLDPVEIGQQISARLVQAADRMMDAAGRLSRVLHLQYREVAASPMAVIRKLYRHCGFELSEVAEHRMMEFLERPRQPSLGKCGFREFGLDAATLRERFARYVRHFAVPEEAAGI